MIRNATLDDVAEVLRLVRGLAEYERLIQHMTATEADIADMLFGDRGFVDAALAECDGRAVGVALWYPTANTFAGRRGIYVEDVFVEAQYRGRGLGLGLFRHIAHAALAQGCVRMEWRVLTWNQPSIDFYRRLGAKNLTDWHTMELRGEALTALAQEPRNG